MKISKSARLWKRALNIFPGGVNSPVRAFKSVGGTPIFMHSGSGSHVRDVDGNKYTDFLSSWGPLILGHRHPAVQKALKKQLKRATTFGAPADIELQLGEFILKEIPFVDKIRFVSSGTEAVMTAIRLARGFTQKNIVLKFEGCYHGHHDSLLVKAGSGLLTQSGDITTASSAGIPREIIQNTISIPLDNEKLLEETVIKNAADLACVIVEPLPANSGLLLQRKAFLEKILSLSKQHKFLVIFDEVISGFRLGFTGFSGREKLSPDLITYGKIIGGGLPAGAVAGKRDIMNLLAPQGPVYQAGTLSGNPLAMAAGYATLVELKKGHHYARLKSLSDFLAEEFSKHIQPLFEKQSFTLSLIRDASLFWMHLHLKNNNPIVRSTSQISANNATLYNHIFHFALKEGFYLAPSAYEVGFLSSAMKKDQLRNFIAVIKSAIQKYDMAQIKF